MDRDTSSPQVTTLQKDVETYISEFHSVAAPATHVGPFVWDYTEEAIGPYCKDINGNIFLDFTSHVAANPLGYNHPEILDMLDSFDSFSPLKIAGQDWYAHSETHYGSKELMEKLTSISSHYGLDTVFLSNSGAEAVENGLKISYDHTKGSYGITFTGAFHGRTIGTLSLNRSKSLYRRDFPEISGIETVPFCTSSDCNQNSCSCGFFHNEDNSILRNKLLSKKSPINPDDVAYIILEPFQGEGGYNIPSHEFMDEIESIREKTGIPLIVDEIQSGLGRSGKMWASDHYSISPDVITSAKATQVGATIGSKDIFPSETGRLSSTWGAGDILNSAIGTKTIELIQENSLMKNAEMKGKHIVEQLQDLNIDGLTEIRGQGLLIAVECASPELQKSVIQESLSKGLLLLGCGTKTIRLLPPLNVTTRECEQAIDILDQSFQKHA